MIKQEEKETPQVSSDDKDISMEEGRDDHHTGSKHRSVGESAENDSNDDDNNDEPHGDGTEVSDAAAVAPLLHGSPPELQISLRLGLAAYRYGSIGYKVECFVIRLLKQFGFNATVLVSNLELTISVFQFESPATPNNENHNHGAHPQDAPPVNPTTTTRQSTDTTMQVRSLPFTVTVPVTEQTELHKLYDLSYICDDLLHKRISTSTAEHRLETLQEKPAHWATWSKCLAYILTSTGFAVVLRGNWTDVWLSITGGTLALLVKMVFQQKCQSTMNTLGLFCVTFLPTIVAKSAELARKDWNVHPTIVVVASVISEVPGFMVTKGVMELAKNRILAGLGHFIQSFLVCLWIAVGAFLAVELVVAIARASNDASDNSDDDSVDQLWYILFAPLLAVCFSIYFDVHRKHVPWAIVVCGIAFGMSLLIPHFKHSNVGNVVAAFVTTVAANIWSRSIHEKILFCVQNPVPNPNSIMLLPAFFILVGGSLGARGFAEILAGDGGEILLEFILVALTLCLGIYLGNILLPSTSVL